MLLQTTKTRLVPGSSSLMEALLLIFQESFYEFIMTTTYLEKEDFKKKIFLISNQLTTVSIYFRNAIL